MVNFPGSLDSLSNPSASSATNSPSHASQHSDANDAIEAIEAKLGTGASTPVANRLLFGTGAGTSAWTAITSAQLAATLSDETGTGSAVFATTPTLVTPKVDTINESTPANGVTIDGLNIKDNALNTNNSVVTANITDSAVTAPKAATGFVVQVVTTNTTAVATGSTVLPVDDTIPQITEGDQYLSLAITPKSATNILVISADLALGRTGTGQLSVAIFQDATANALAASTFNVETATAVYSTSIVHKMVAGTTSSTTFRIRAGGASASTTTLNGSGGGRIFGGVSSSILTIFEYKA